MSLSSLAQEILADLPGEFPDGATMGMLRDWLGEPFDRIKPAIYELTVRRLAHHRASRLFFGERRKRRSANAIGLTEREQTYLDAIMERNIASREDIIRELYGKNNAPDWKILDVYVCFIRKKLEPLGITIETVFGVGYTIPEASKEIVRSRMLAA